MTEPIGKPVVERLLEHQTKRGLNDTTFAQTIAISTSTWSRLKDGTYPLKDDTRISDKLLTAVRILDDEDAYGRPSAAIPLINTSAIRMVADAVKVALRQERNRLVVYLARTGGGKTAGVARKIEETYPRRAVRAEACETWRNSYFAAARDLAKASGVKEELSGAAHAQRALIEHLNRERPIIVIDEAHYFGARTLNLVKAVLNQTPCVVVLLAIPSLWRSMERSSWEEAEQLRCRTVAKIEASEIKTSDAASFIRELVPQAEKMDGFSACVEKCRSAANRFGLYDTLARICSEVRLELDGGKPTADVFECAIANVEALRK